MWTIGDVAALSGVTSRTLRHYDAIGLLTPSGTGPGGRRLYDHSALLRLQQILVVAELGLDLGTIAGALDGEGGDDERIRILRVHHQRLVAEAARLGRLAATVRATIDNLEGGTEMAAEDMFEGFDQREHEAEARHRWGDDAVSRGNATWSGLGDRGQADFQREMGAVTDALAEAMAAGTAAGSDSTQELVARLYALVSTFWTPDSASFAALGQMYVDDPRFTATYEGVAPGLTAYVRDAMAIYAATRLKDRGTEPE